MNVQVIKDEESGKFYAHLFNRNEVFMARVEVPDEIQGEGGIGLADYLRTHHAELLKRIY